MGGLNTLCGAYRISTNNIKEIILDIANLPARILKPQIHLNYLLTGIED